MKDQDHADILRVAIKHLGEVLRAVNNAGLEVTLTCDSKNRTDGAKVTRTFVAYNPESKEKKK